MKRFESVTGGTASHSTRLPNNGNQVAGFKPLMWFTTLLLAAVVAGCGNGVTDPVLGGGGATGLPTVTAVTPVNNDTGVPINRKITATFSEPMAPIASANFTLTCASPCVNPTGTVALDVTKRIATYTPAANLAPTQLYTATITTGAKSLATGRTLASSKVWSFTTGTAVVSMIPPRVTLTVPATATPPTTNVVTNTTISAVFSKDMYPATLVSPATNFTVTCAAPCVSPAGAVSYDVGSKTAVYTPTAALKASTTYTATITTAAMDLIGNALAGNQATLPNNYVWTFTTAAGPVVAAPVTVLSTSISPAAAAVGVCPDASINATFTVPSGLRMDPATVNTTTFTVTGPGSTVVTAASVLLDVATGRTATFTTSAALTNGVTYTATIKSGASGVKDMAIPANAMVSDYTWSFTAGPATGVCAPPVVIVNLGKASTFGMAASAGVTNTNTAPITHINGDVVLTATPTCNAVAVDNVGGFGLCGSNGSTPTINGTVITPVYPDTTTATAIMNDLRAAFLSITPPAGPPAAGSLTANVNLPAGTTLGGVPGSALVQGTNYFVANSYQSTTTILVTGDLTLDAQGNPNAVFVFQSSGSVGTAAGAPGACTPSTCAHTRILLVGGAKASNVWWQAGTDATLELYSEFQGNILASRTIAMKTGATSCGRLLAGAFTSGQFTFDSNIVSVPGQPFAPPAGYSTICQ